jgi:hypothetical protein
MFALSSGGAYYHVLHRGSDGFIGLPAFERFYWPQLKTLMLKLIDVGITLVAYYEGCNPELVKVWIDTTKACVVVR